MSHKQPIYLDYNATTPVDPRVFEVMKPFFCDAFGNAASAIHRFGQVAKKAVDKATEQAATLLFAEPKEIIWTSGSTESNNLAIKGVAQMYRDKGRHIITQTTEHKAVLDPCKRLQKEGYDVTWLTPDSTGRVSAKQVREAIRPDTILCAIMWANNEIGTIQPIREIGQACREQGVLFFTDATQAVGKLEVDVTRDHIDLLSYSGHKMYGPKGCGVLYVRSHNPRVRLTAILDGGGHQQGFRSGTLNVPGIVGVGAASELCMREMSHEHMKLKTLRDKLEKGIMARLDKVRLNGHPEHRLPHTSNLSFEGTDSESIMLSLDDLAVSSGSACTSASREPSFVLRNIGLSDELAHASIRFSLGRWTTPAEIDQAIERVAKTVEQLRTGVMV